MPIAVKVAVGFKITRAWFTSTCDVDIIDRDVAATTLTAENVVISTFFSSGTGDILDCNVLDDDAVGRVASRPTVEVVLLDVDTIDGNVRDIDVLK